MTGGFRDGIKRSINKLLHDDTGTPKVIAKEFVGCRYNKVDNLTEALRKDVFKYRNSNSSLRWKKQ